MAKRKLNRKRYGTDDCRDKKGMFVPVRQCIKKGKKKR